MLSKLAVVVIEDKVTSSTICKAADGVAKLVHSGVGTCMVARSGRTCPAAPFLAR